MDENKEEKDTEYTGEYGNSVEGNYTEESSNMYSYSYKNGEGQSTHSGDYYASQQTANQSGATDTAQSSNGQYSNNASDAQSNTNNGFTNFGNDHFQSEGFQNGNYQNQNGNPGGPQNFYQNQPNNGGKAPKQKKPKKPMGFGKKVVLTVAGAVVFGLVAGVCFNGVNYVFDRMNGGTTQQLDKTTVSNNATGKPSTNDATDNSGNSGSTAITDVSAITEQTMPAVVAITSTSEGTAYYDLFGQYSQGEDSTSAGSGFIVGQNEKELLIATNNHVIDGAKTISVQFIDGEIYEATEKGSDSSNDLAVVAVPTSKVKKDTMDKIKIADLGSSDDVKVGEMVIAIGNALGYGQSVTVGYISAKDREITEASETGTSQNKIKAIQTDAAINPGNSGGALINMQGQVIGINSAKIAADSVEGVGYAIPISVATPIIDELMNRETLSDADKGYLGISGSTVSEAATAYNVPYGVYVKEVASGGAADKGGIKANDVITAINKMEVTTMESLQEKVNSYKKGTEITITLQRSNNGKYSEKEVKVTLQGSESLNNLSDGNANSNDTQGNDSQENNQNKTTPYNNQGGNGSGDSLWDQFFN